MHHQYFDHAQGCFALVADGGSLIGILWRNHHEEVVSELQRRYPASQDKSSEFLSRVLAEVTAFLAGKSRQLDLPHELRGVTPFQKRVLRALQSWPYGSTLTYGELAREVGSPRAARAVGAAMAANPLPLLIPCHRVVGADNRLTGYSGGRGLSSKQYLLALETGGKF